MSSLVEAVRAGRSAEVVSLLDGMTDAERRAEFPELRAVRKELRAEPWSAEARRVYPALHAAGAACQTGAAGVAAWIAASDMRWSSASPGVLIDLLGDRPPAWLADVAHRLAARPVTSRVSYELMAGLVRLAGCPVPTTEAYVQGWVDHIGHVWQRGDTILDRLRKDPHLTELVAALFETADIGGRLFWGSDEGEDGWSGALARLTAEGALDRAATVDACVARLLRGGPAADHRAFLRMLQAFTLTRDEERERVADWLALASDGPSVVAAHAQSVLASLALDGELPARRLAEMSGAVLFRTEKKLVRAQLILLGKVLARDASTAGELLPAVAQAFGHEDSDVQERALKLVERHRRGIGSDTVRDELRSAAEQLSPALRRRAADVLGVSLDAAEPLAYEEVLPPAPQPVRVAPAPASATELAEEVGALLAAGGDVAAFERTVDGLVREAHRDRKGLLEALEPVLAQRWWHRSDAQRHPVESSFTGPYGLVGPSHALELLLATVAGAVPTTALRSAVVLRTASDQCGHAPLIRAFETRIWELAFRFRTEPLPFLLSTPTWGTGLLEPEDLVARLEEYRRLGARASQADFTQALLRVRRGDRARAGAVAERAAALGTAEGTRLAEWLASAPPTPVIRRGTPEDRVLVQADGIPEFLDGLPDGFRTLGLPVSGDTARWSCYHWHNDIRPHWLAVLPEGRELVAVRLLRDVSFTAIHDSRGEAAILPLLAESGGQAGDAVRLAVAHGLGARHPQDRLAAVDALLVLASRGQLDAAGLGADLGDLARRGVVKPSRLVDSVRTAMSTGAYGTVWETLRHTLPVLLADMATGAPTAPARGLADLLSAAAECAERTGARGEVPHLAGTADRRGSSRLVGQARRLHTALTTDLAA
ncbi:hypothetical protein F8R89_05495 [Streptomyces sp. SS1-1]|uniref:DUF7824 domain-containing protein n=1 Tax=Streptomyces sp. SS1-1 TaxID=2651869 RepID=UPI00125037B6|nr:DUF6493 family protein [Streptomyces sp. SS1-1]KAB2971549.1 hypothetical protein F8R89_05495 [Streptomyces sp. SS1-1]